jgi:uncharacterized protein (TIGR02147 family)
VVRRRAAVDVFAFLDYRAYLRAFYDEAKQSRVFSYRVFARRAKLRSPNYLKLVTDGQRNLSPAMAERFAEACGLEGDAAEYFRELVGFAHARTSTEQNERYARLRGYRRYRSVHRLDVAQDAYHSRWYLPAIRELVMHAEFSEDPAWIADKLVPSIKASEAELALQTLTDLGMLVRDATGRLRQGTRLVSTGAETRSLHLANFHRAMMAHAAESLDRIPAAERDISSVTLCMGPTGLAAIKLKIQRFRAELLALSDLEAAPEQVVQVNFQLFPLSRLEAKDQEAP